MIGGLGNNGAWIPQVGGHEIQVDDEHIVRGEKVHPSKQAATLSDKMHSFNITLLKILPRCLCSVVVCCQYRGSNVETKVLGKVASHRATKAPVYNKSSVPSILKTYLTCAIAYKYEWRGVLRVSAANMLRYIAGRK